MGAFTRIRVERAIVKEIGLNSLILALQYAASALVPVILVPHIVRTIGIAPFGNIAVALAWATFASTAVHYAFHLTGPKRVAQLGDHETPTGIFAEIFLAKLLLFASFVPIILAVMWNTVSPAMRGIDMLIVLTLPAASVLNSTWYLQARDRFIWITVAAVIGTSVALWFGFREVIDNSNASIWAAAGACVLGPLLANTATLIAAAAFVDYRSSLLANISPIGALREGWPLFASQFVATLYGASGPIVITHLSGSRDAGAYGAVDRFVAAIMGACLLAHTAAYPRLAATYARDQARYGRLLVMVVAAYIGLTGALAAAGWAWQTRLVEFLLGRGRGYEDLLVWGLMYMVVGIFGTAVTGYLTVSGHANQVLRLTLTILVLSFLFGIPGAWLFGAAGWMASRVISQAPNLVAAVRLWKHEKSSIGGERMRT